MARRKSKKKIKAKRAQQSANKPSARLSQAVEFLEQGRTEDAELLAQNVLKRVTDGELYKQAQQVVAEAAFRQAAATPDLQARLRLFARALEQTPDDGRLHYHRGLALLHSGNFAEAQKEFDWLVANDAAQAHTGFLQQATRLMQERAADENGLAPDARDLLQLVQSFVGDGPKAEVAAHLKSASLLPKEATDLWLALLDMREKPKSASEKTMARLAGATELSSVASYYLGVAALRKKEVQPALDAWQSAAQSGFYQHWFNENRFNLLREQTSEMAKEEKWQEIVELTSGQVDPDGDKVLAETVAAAHFHLGFDAVQRNNWSLALSHWQQASELKLSRQLAQNLAIAYEKQEAWSEAAQTWREMVRRRPRKASHPDYLSDSQVATIWTRAGGCYHRAELETDGYYEPLYEEKLTCYKNAVKYDPENLDLRMRLVLAYLEEDRDEAAENELERILEIDPDNVPALLRLGVLYDEQWEADPLPLWERALEIEPNNVDARNAVVSGIVNEIGSEGPRSWLARLNPLSGNEKIKRLKAATERVPNHPKLLLLLGRAYWRDNKHKEALQTLSESWDADPKNPASFGGAVHELLHVKGGEKVVEEKLPSVRAISSLRATFWLEQAELVMNCELDEQWVSRFWDEAVLIAEHDKRPDSLAVILCDIMDFALTEDLLHLTEKYEARINNELAHTGAVEYLEALKLRESETDPKDMLRVLRRAEKKAKAAKDTELLEKIELISEMLSNPLSSIMSRLGGLGGLGGFDPFADDDDDDYDLNDIDPREVLEELMKNLGGRR